jgi:hypothetical protein
MFPFTLISERQIGLWEGGCYEYDNENVQKKGDFSLNRLKKQIVCLIDLFICLFFPSFV